MRPLYSATRAVLIALAVGLAWGPPARSQTPPIPVLPARQPADTDTLRRPPPPPGTTTIPGLELPLELNLRVEGKKERDRNLVCTSLEAIQTSAVSGCNAGFLPWSLQPTVSIKSSGVVADRWHVNVDYDMQREFDASQLAVAVLRGHARVAMAARRRRQHHASRRRRRDFCRRTCPRETTASRSRISSVRSVCSRSSRSRRATSVRRASSRSAARAAGEPTATSTTTRSSACASSSPSIPRCSAAAGVPEHRHSEPLAARRASRLAARHAAAHAASESTACSSARSRRIPSGPRFRVRGGQTNGTADVRPAARRRGLLSSIGRCSGSRSCARSTSPTSGSSSPTT